MMVLINVVVIVFVCYDNGMVKVPVVEVGREEEW